MGNNFAEMMAAKRAAAAGGQVVEPTPKNIPLAKADPEVPKVNSFAAKLALSKAIEAGTPNQAAPVAVKPKFGIPGRTPPANTTTDDDLGMDLDSLLDSEDEGIAPSDDPDYEVQQVMSQFDDETPATAPTREVPEDADKGLRQFVEMIDGIYGILHEPELLGNVIRGIMVELKANPQYMQQVADNDIRVWVRAMRSTMGLAKIRKTESKAKRAGGGAKKGKGVDADMESAFNELGIDFDNL